MVDSLEQSLAAARKVVDEAQAAFAKVEEQREAAAGALLDANERLMRIERAIAILNGEEESVQEPAPSTKNEQPAKVDTAPPAPPPQPAGPYARVKCSGCQAVGSMGEVHRNTKNGTIVRLLVCSDCNNEVYLG